MMSIKLQNVTSLKIRMKILLAFVLGLISALVQAPYNLIPLLFIGLSGLYVLISTATKKRHSFFIGYTYMLGYFGLGLYWIGNALLVADNPYWWAWPLSIAGLPIILGIFAAIACIIHTKFFSSTSWTSYFGFVGLLSISEWARGNLFTGFPWNLFGYSWSFSLAMMQSVSLINIFDFTFLTILWASVLGYLLLTQDQRNTKITISLCAILSLLGFYIYGMQRLQSSETKYNKDFRIVIAQPNVNQGEKWKREKIIQNFENLVVQSQNSGLQINTPLKATYIIWPETSFPYAILGNTQGKNVISNMLHTYQENSYVIGGTLRYEPQNDFYFNSIVLLNKYSNTLDTYNKNHLVPFGEYMPMSNIIDIAPVVGFKGFETGDGYRPTKTPEGLSYFPLVCYEIIFPNLINSENISNTDFIVNTTNDGWYGISAGPYQHLAQAQFRAVETGLPVARAANTGISTLIDPYGRILQESKLFTKQNIESYLPEKIKHHSKSSGNILASLIIISLFTCFCILFERKKHLQIIIE